MRKPRSKRLSWWNHWGLLILSCLMWSMAVNLPAEERASPKHGNFSAEVLKVGDTRREYRLVVPKTVDLTKPAPLVIAFHGMLIDSKDVMPQYTELNEAAEKHRFILAYPNGIDHRWGLAPSRVAADLKFFDEMVKELTATYRIDRDRVYVTGMSNGAYFAHVVGHQRSETVAAVAAHSGMLGMETAFGIRAKRKYPVLIIVGDQDRLMPPKVARESRDKYLREGHEVKYVEIPGLGHMWGTKSGINETIWKFFEEHPRTRGRG